MKMALLQTDPKVLAVRAVAEKVPDRHRRNGKLMENRGRKRQVEKNVVAKESAKEEEEVIQKQHVRVGRNLQLKRKRANSLRKLSFLPLMTLLQKKVANFVSLAG
jgi:hypothetical protein